MSLIVRNLPRTKRAMGGAAPKADWEVAIARPPKAEGKPANSSAVGSGSVPWSCTARWRMPVQAWRDAMAAHYPAGGWVALQTETLDALAARKAQRGDHSFDATIQGLLA